ncbi:hypothetical protein NBRC10512_002390 [Rhodotorula toruloides]|uniref:Zinc finger, C3HC4 RING-type protein n=1 Tax=Rhodotorula toruloides (strain NP11) TaxID=1130832 RepID=M7WW61_RHOT1|nr:zinc finger, C3HC4 RING-type protein [Rhodotorula toruloides NP11]EMS22321.1 zinc finger, C3HC4 RING-type protein [Rhodotorula toruloides NP11]
MSSETAPLPPEASHTAPEASDTSHTFPPHPHDDSDVPPVLPRDAPQVTVVGLTPALQMRLSLLRRLWLASVEMQGVRRRRLLFFGVIGLAQLVAWIVILAMHYHDPCDKPLAPYLVMVTVRIFVAFPLSFYNAVTPRLPTRRDNDTTRAVLEANRRIGSPILDRRVRWAGDLVSILGLVLLVAGSFWLGSSKTCQMTAPALYKSAVAALILSWLWMAELAIYVVLAILFLPFLLVGMRWFGLGQAKNEIGPLGKADIEKLPQRIFVGTKPELTDLEDGTTPSTSSQAQAPSTTPSPSRRPRQKQWWRLWRSKNSSTSQKVAGGDNRLDGDHVSFPPGVEGILLPESQTACSICLCEYEVPPSRSAAEASEWKVEENLLRLLPCGHALHSECLGEWLVPALPKAGQRAKVDEGKEGRAICVDEFRNARDGSTKRRGCRCR